MVEDNFLIGKMIYEEFLYFSCEGITTAKKIGISDFLFFSYLICKELRTKVLQFVTVSIV